MFGYVTICKDLLSEQGYEMFRSYYCGLCRETGRRCSHAARMGLSYDITFLAILLSSVDADESDIKDRRCLLHPLVKKGFIENDRALSYAADMGVILSYLKILDDWHDDRSIKSLFALMFFYAGVRKAKKRYPRIYCEVRRCLDNLSALEKGGCDQIDETADCFAKILELLFTPDFISAENEKRILAWLGYNIGRWIYIIDAYNDLEKDIKKKDYNTFVSANCGKTAEEIKNKIRETLNVSMTFTLENAASAYDLLNIVKNKEILDNIMYTALKMKQDYILGEKHESL